MIRAVFFDCDGVLMFGNPWLLLANEVKLPRELDNSWWTGYYNGEITFEQWMANVRNFYIKAGLTKARVDKVMQMSNYTINEEAVELVDFLKKKGVEVAIISSGAEEYVKNVANHFGIKDYRVNTIFVYDKEGKFVRIDTNGEDPDVKVNNINEICRSKGIKPGETILIGDSDNDLKAFDLTKHGILYGETRPELAKHAWKRVNDLRDIIKIIEDENANSN